MSTPAAPPPPSSAPRSLAFGGRRLLRQLLACLLTLLVVDTLGRRLLGDTPLPTPGERLPSDRETLMLPFWLDALKQPAAVPKLVFLGSSPTWGTAMPNFRSTYPVQFGRSWEQARPQQPVQIHNLAAKGFLAADLNSVLKASLPHGDGFVIQLNYHTFSPRLLAQTPMRHPDLPERLGVPVSYAEARLLATRPSPLLNLNAPLRQFLRQFWWFYREREHRVAAQLGLPPEAWLHARAMGETQTDNEETPSDGQPFYDLKPARQLFIMQRYSQNARFEIQPSNLEAAFLHEMLTQLRQAGKPALFYMAPINMEALSYYEALDLKQYTRNVSRIRNAVQAAGFAWFDANLDAPLSENFFADVSHTLPEGGAHFGALLYRASADYWRARL
ncbi:MAG: hypothetical protein ACO1RX_13335 [Candidatus Sericytochromatia bacterium]